MSPALPPATTEIPERVTELEAVLLGVYDEAKKLLIASMYDRCPGCEAHPGEAHARSCVLSALFQAVGAASMQIKDERPRGM